MGERHSSSIGNAHLVLDLKGNSPLRQSLGVAESPQRFSLVGPSKDPLPTWAYSSSPFPFPAMPATPRHRRTSEEAELNNIRDMHHVSANLHRSRSGRGSFWRRWSLRGGRRGGVRMPSGVSLPPMPGPDEVDSRFERVLRAMDLPLDKARVLRQYDQKKKWELVCDQDKMEEKEPPSHYLSKLHAYMDKKTLKKKRKELGEESSTNVLKHLEISLRTNSIDWVKTFLAEDGLRTIVRYLGVVQEAGGLADPPVLHASSEENGVDAQASTSNAPNSAVANVRTAIRSKSSNSFPSKLLNPEDDIHVGIQCLRAVMNNKAGFNGVFSEPEAIYAIARSILHHSLRTKAQVLELLAAICLVKGGHELIMAAFDRFQRAYNEPRRFATLFHFFSAAPEFHVDFMVTAMQFINIVVHSVDDLNYRIFLQVEWKRLGLEDSLERLSGAESSELQTQIQAYQENLYDVATLVAESEERTEAIRERDAAGLALSQANERLQEQEADYLMQMGQLDHRMQQLLQERDRLAKAHQSNDNEVHTLKRLLSEKDRELKTASSTLEARIAELERAKAQLSADKRPANPLAHPPAPGPPSSKPSPPLPPPRSEETILTTAGHSPPPPPPTAVPAPPPPPPPPPPPSSIPPPPPPPGPPPPPSLKGLNAPAAPFDVMTIKRRIQTRYKLPQLNWTPLKPNQLKNTVFDDLDDDKVMEAIDFNRLEELFKLGLKPGTEKEKDERTDATVPVAKKATENTLLDHKRLRNLAITRRKVGMEPVALMSAVHRFDLSSLELEKVELLLRILPSSEETAAYKAHEAAGKSLESLSEEDRFFGQLCRIERLQAKLQIMAFMGNFAETAELIQPQLRILMAAAAKARDARRFHRVLELVLAYGNYMNSAKRGGAYGFKLQSLESLGFLKSPQDKSLTLLHLLAQTVAEKFPELLSFGEELSLAEKASGVGLESVLADLAELERGWAAAAKEAQSRGADAPPLLQTFLAEGRERMSALSEQAKLAQESYRSCLEWYGETGKSLDSAAFFSLLHNFARRFTAAHEENLERKKAELRAAAEEERRRRLKESKAGGGVGGGEEGGTLAERQAAVVEEMKASVVGARSGGGRQRPPQPRRRTRKIEQTDLYDGALDQIMDFIRNTPFTSGTSVAGPPVPEKRNGAVKAAAEISRERQQPSAHVA